MITKRNALFDECARRITPEQAREIDHLLDSGYSLLVDVSTGDAVVKSNSTTSEKTIKPSRN